MFSRVCQDKKLTFFVSSSTQSFCQNREMTQNKVKKFLKSNLENWLKILMKRKLRDMHIYVEEIFKLSHCFQFFSLSSFEIDRLCSGANVIILLIESTKFTFHFFHEIRFDVKARKSHLNAQLVVRLKKYVLIVNC